MKPIIFATEFSEHAPNVFEFTLALGRALDTRVYAVHGFGKPEVRFWGDDLPTKQKNVENRLTSFIQENLPEGEESEVEPLAIYGFAAEAVIEAADKVQAELIVLGMRGSEKPAEKQIGSTAKEILKKAGMNRMVLAIPVGTGFNGLKKLSFFTRFEYKDLRALAVMIDLANHFESQLEIFHILEKGESMEEAERNMDILKRILNALTFVSFQIVEGDRKKVLKEHVKQGDVDLVAMLSHRQTFLGGLIEGDLGKEMIGEVSVPLLAFRS